MDHGLNHFGATSAAAANPRNPVPPNETSSDKPDIISALVAGIWKSSPARIRQFLRRHRI